MKFWRNIAYLLRFVGTLTLAGGLAGLLGMLLSYFLFEVQHLAFGYSYHSVISGETYLEGVRQSSALRRVAALAVCGLVAGGGWFLLFRYGRRLVSIPGAVGDSRLRMPPMETASNAFLQIATIGIGSPLGKEGAPREIGALFAGFAARWARLNSEHTRLVIAAGAGAGLAAVYNAPIGGAFFALGIMTGRIKASMPARWIAAFTVSILATLVARWGLGDVHQYAVPGQAKVTPGLRYGGPCWSDLRLPLPPIILCVLRIAAEATGQRICLSCPCVWPYLCCLARPWYFCPNWQAMGALPPKWDFLVRHRFPS